MQKVMCVNHDRYEGDIPYGPDDPQIGDECIVNSTCIGYAFNGDERPCYDLKGYSKYYYDQRNFATLPDESADEMQEEAREAIINIETVLV